MIDKLYFELQQLFFRGFCHQLVIMITNLLFFLFPFFPCFFNFDRLLLVFNPEQPSLLQFLLPYYQINSNTNELCNHSQPFAIHFQYQIPSFQSPTYSDKWEWEKLQSLSILSLFFVHWLLQSTNKFFNTKKNLSYSL